MATRLYLPSTGTPPISPAFDASWDLTGSAVRRQARRGRINSAQSDSSISETSATVVDVLHAQYVFGPIGAGAITGTIKGQIACREANTNADYRAQIVARVVSSDGATVRGTLYGPDTAALSSEFNASASATVNRQFPRGGAQTVTSVTAQEGDFIVIEVGYHSHNTITNSIAGVLRLGDPNSTNGDLPEDETTSGNNAVGWIEFSYDFPIVADDSYDEAIRDTGTVYAYWKTADTSGPMVDRANSHNIPVEAGAPTFGGTGPHTGWKSISTDGVDDLLRKRSQDGVETYQGPLTVVGWARTADAAQTHGEGWWITLQGGTLEGGHTFEQRDTGSGRKWDLHYLDEGLTASDLQAEATAANVWRFWAATFGANGVRFLVANPTGDTLAWDATDVTVNMDQGAFECLGFGTDQAGTQFGQWEFSRVAVWKSELTLAQVQTIYDAAAAAVTGTLAETQDDQTSTASGTHTPPAITGTVAETQDDQTSTASGTHTPPSFTGTVSETQDDQTSTASGTHTPPAITGTLAETQANQTVDASGTHTPPAVSGSAAVIEASDTSTATGTVVNFYTGTATVTQGNQTPSASGTASSPSGSYQDNRLFVTSQQAEKPSVGNSQQSSATVGGKNE